MSQERIYRGEHGGNETLRAVIVVVTLIVVGFSVADSNSFRVTVQRQLIFPFLDTEQGRREYIQYVYTI